MTKSALYKKFIEGILCNQESNLATVYLLNGIALVGNILDYDDNCILLSNYKSSEILILTHSVTSIQAGDKYKIEAQEEYKHRRHI